MAVPSEYGFENPPYIFFLGFGSTFFVAKISSFFLIISCQETKKTEEPTKLSSTAEAIKNYKINFEWDKGYEAWSKVPTTDDYHMSAPLIGLEATGPAEIEEIIFGFVTIINNFASIFLSTLEKKMNFNI